MFHRLHSGKKIDVTLKNAKSIFFNITVVHINALPTKSRKTPT